MSILVILRVTNLSPPLKCRTGGLPPLTTWLIKRLHWKRRREGETRLSIRSGCALYFFEPSALLQRLYKSFTTNTYTPSNYSSTQPLSYFLDLKKFVTLFEIEIWNCFTELTDTNQVEMKQNGHGRLNRLRVD